MTDHPGPSVWARAVADPAFRAALIEDPLRALADAPEVHAPAEVVHRLEAMTPDERAEAVREVILRVTRMRAREQWGDRFWSPDEGPAPG